MRSRLIICGIVLFMLLGSSVMAETTGKIVGKVTDELTGEPIIGANIYLEDTGMGSMTDFKGEYFIIGVRPGSYTLICTYIGYSKTIIQDTRVNIDLSTIKNIELSQETIKGEEVIVVSQRMVVEKGLSFPRYSWAGYPIV